MAEHLVTFDIAPGGVHVPTGALLSEAASQAGVEINATLRRAGTLRAVCGAY